MSVRTTAKLAKGTRPAKSAKMASSSIRKTAYAKAVLLLARLVKTLMILASIVLTGTNSTNQIAPASWNAQIDVKNALTPRALSAKRDMHRTLMIHSSALPAQMAVRFAKTPTRKYANRARLATNSEIAITPAKKCSALMKTASFAIQAHTVRSAVTHISPLMAFVRSVSTPALPVRVSLNALGVPQGILLTRESALR